MTIKHFAVAAATVLVLPAYANLLVNGDFEADVGDVPNNSYTPVLAGANTIDGWTVGGVSVDLIRNAWGSINNVSVDLAGTPGPGSLSQTFNQVAGQKYTLTWDYFKNSPGTVLTVEFGELSAATFQVPSNISTASLSYTATTSNASALVRFSGGTAQNTNFGPTIDNVILTAVPEVEAYGLALAGMGVVAFVMRRNRRT